MRADVARDLSNSARDFVETVAPFVSRRGWWGPGAVESVELWPRDQRALFDRYAGIDAWQIVHEHGLMRGVASRVQYLPHAYASFTIRETRASGAETELEKRVRARALCGGWLLPYFTVQAYMTAPRGQLVAVGLCRTDRLLDLIERGAYDARRVYDGNRMLVVWWASFGPELVTHGDAFLRKRAAK